MSQKISKGEETILRDIIALAQRLPQPIDTYTREIGRLREVITGPNHGNPETPKGFMESRTIRVRPQYGVSR